MEANLDSKIMELDDHWLSYLNPDIMVGLFTLIFRRHLQPCFLCTVSSNNREVLQFVL